MAWFRVFMIALFVGISAYTVPVVAREGIYLFPAYFGEIAAHRWPGQFIVDFTCCLALFAMWTAWRNQFSALGILLALGALFLGSPFMAAYLLYLSFVHRGDVVAMLTGANHRTTA
ncbi:DUF1475 domain-containing protein [Sphingomonas antarctica]|uniref:hypothetical protein n=1 Tax=Sphingomonas antarctica TaxID=2040274 RepID=UPI0039E9D3EE